MGVMRHSELEGRIAIGLDEFMLRLGHLTILGRQVGVTGGTRDRVSRVLAAQLTRSVPVHESDFPTVGKYLLEKRLAAHRDATGTVTPARSGARYAHLICSSTATGEVSLVEDVSSRAPAVWMQDYCMAHRDMPSHLGAVTVSAGRGEGKTGVSHLVDWGVVLGFSSPRLSLTAVGRAAVSLADDESTEWRNPYLLRRERVAYLWLLFTADSDVLTRVLSRMSEVEAWRKQDAAIAIAQIGAEIIQQARSASSRYPTRVLATARSFALDVGLDPRKIDPTSFAASSAWHRVASRLESLVDLGLVEKFLPSGHDGRYEYLYRASARGRQAAEWWGQAASTMEFLEAHVAWLAFGPMSRDASSTEASELLLEAYLVVAGPTGAHIDAVCVVACALAATHGLHLSAGNARAMLVGSALRYPGEVALSRGYSGSRPEAITLRGAASQRMGSALFR